MRRTGGVGGRLLGAIALLVAARLLPAQTRACSSSADSVSTSAAHWGAPLDRPVTLHASELSLRNALDRLATTAKLKLSYSAEFLPLDREVCVSADTAPVGEVLGRLLAGTNVSPVPMGGDQVVLAPRAPSASRTAEPTADMSNTLNVLDRVVVTGSATATGAPERELTVGLNVLSGRQLTRQNTSTISDALDAYVPGIWTWTQSPSSMLSSYASIRGASSFGLSYPKIYIDGIEVANPLLLSRFNPGSIDRIEVIRGPQGSALYGTDAISGVVNIVTRHEGADGDGRNMVVRSTAGFAQSQYGRDVLTQDHTVSLVAGSSTKSADLHIEAGGMGSFVPDGYSQNLTAAGGARFVGTRGTLSTTARLFTQRAGSPDSPLVVLPSPASDSSRSNAPQSVTEYTLGVTGTLDGGNHWLHSFVAGIDGYNLANVQTNFTPVPSVADSALRAAQGSAARGTLRASSVLQLGSGGPTHGSLTFSAEHAMLRVSSVGVTTMIGPDPTSRSGPGTSSTTYLPKVTWQSSTGVTTQANAAFDNILFATAGLRIERDSRLSDDHPVAALPMLGVATVRDYGPFSVKVRAAYGKGIRPPATTSRWQFYQPRNALPAELGAEEQTGTELGIDFVLRRGLSLNVTRFDQRASGLIQPVAVEPVQQSGGGPRKMNYELQNVGAISNSGWEIEATGNPLSRLSATAALTFVDSRVGQLSPTYTGDLREGDRMLQVPATTASFNLGWEAPHWTASLGGSRAFNWINYDELQLANDWLNDSRPMQDLRGPGLRQYWREYNGGFRLRASLSRDLRRDLSFELTGDNLLNYQRGEPDDITIVPGRTILTGLRLKF